MMTARSEYSSRKITPHITSRQIEVLALLARQEQWSVGEVAAALSVSPAAATKAIARLEKKGLVTRSVDRMDRRCVNVRVTRAGREAIRQSASAM